MQVRDLIYLLQTRCQPEDQVFFTAMFDQEDGSIEQLTAEADESLLSVFVDELQISKGIEERRATVDIGRVFARYITEYFTKKPSDAPKGKKKKG